MDHFFYLRTIMGLLIGLIIISSITFGFDLSMIAKVLLPGSIILLIVAAWLLERQRSSSMKNTQFVPDSNSVSNEQRDSEWNQTGIAKWSAISYIKCSTGTQKRILQVGSTQRLTKRSSGQNKASRFLQAQKPRLFVSPLNLDVRRHGKAMPELQGIWDP